MSEKKKYRVAYALHGFVEVDSFSEAEAHVTVEKTVHNETLIDGISRCNVGNIHQDAIEIIHVEEFPTFE